MTTILEPIDGLWVVIAIAAALVAWAIESMLAPKASERVLIVGSGALARGLIQAIESRRSHWRIAGVAVESFPQDTPPYPLLGRVSDLASLIAKVRPHRVIVALDEKRGCLPVDPLLEANLSGVLVEDGTQVYERLTAKLAIESLPPIDMVFAKGLGRRPAHSVMARLVSLLAAIVGLAVTLPLFALLPLLIRLESRGPVFFVQERVGWRGRRFRLVKFRTMHPSVVHLSEWERDNGGRITRVGRLLRKLHLDELPQFWNLLRGDMNLIGPRPHPVSNFELFNASIPFYALRHAVRPGLTGWAQIRYGYANDLEEETEKMRYDLYYVVHRSLWLDLGIALATIRILLLGRGMEAIASLRRPAAAKGLGHATGSRRFSHAR